LLYKCRQDDVSGDAYVNLRWTKHFDYTGTFLNCLLVFALILC